MQWENSSDQCSRKIRLVVEYSLRQADKWFLMQNKVYFLSVEKDILGTLWNSTVGVQVVTFLHQL